ncbi:MAG: leucine-rich repeat protein, partial [Erysipelotrichales bacterium]|nr:leucine-rich repeat protein [Erysipelotrichales bacterium]
MKKRSIMLPMIMFALVGCSEKTSAELPSLSEGNSSSEIPSATTPSISESNSENTDIPPIDESSYSNEYFMAENFSVWKTSQNYDVDEKLIIKYTSEEVDVTSSKKYNLNTYITVNSGYNITWYKGLDNYSSVIATQQDYLGYGDNIYRLAITNPSGQFIVSFAINIYVLADFTFTYFECQPGYVLASQMPIYQTQTVREGTIISGPIDNPNNGYTFKKWVTHNSETGNYEEYDFTSPITSNKTFFATYEDIMLDLGDGVNTEISFSPYLTSKLDNFIMPKEENKFFDGWYSNDTQYFDDTGIATNPLPYSEINNLKPNFVSFTQDKYFEFTKLEDKNGYSIRLKEMPTYSTELIIPNEHNDLPVVEIEDSAFYGCSSLTSITIPSSAKSIGSSAFERCTNL